MSEGNDERLILHLTLVMVAGFVMLYSLLVMQEPLLGTFVVLLLFGAYLAWRFFHLAARFVVAFERIADAMEAQQ